MLLGVDGELVLLGRGSVSTLRARLHDEAIDWELTALLDEDAKVAAVAPDEVAPLRKLLGRWHADEGVLRADLGRLQDALAAAELRRRLVAS